MRRQLRVKVEKQKRAFGAGAKKPKSKVKRGENGRFEKVTD